MMKSLPLVSRYDGLGWAAGREWTGVAYVHDQQVMGSGVLLSSGLHLLTVAHLVDALDLENGDVVFETAAGSIMREILSVSTYPEMMINDEGVRHDLALITLKQAAPETAERYELYSGTDEVNKTVTLVGYGRAQDIYGRELSEWEANRRAGENTIDALASAFEQDDRQGSVDAQLCYDYDDGTTAHDSIGRLLDSPQLGLGTNEGMITPGDSGGGLFIARNGEQLLAGINSYVTHYPPADLTREIDGSVGDIGVATRVSSYLQWIEEETGQVQVPVANSTIPPAVDDVALQVDEGEGVWFLVQLSANATQPSSVDFATHDGSAVAGQDYIPTRGALILATGERWAKIWVQTLADNRVEGDETFYLTISNPAGATFPDDHTELTAMRTIVDDVSLMGVTDLVPELFG